MSQTLLFGDDGSVAADVAWLWVSNHSWPGWRVEVLRAVVPVAVKVGAVPQAPEWHHGPPRSLSGTCGFDDFANLVVDQDPRIALTRHSDLLVIGDRGPGLLKRLHLGSTAEWLLSRPPSPLVIARHGRPTHHVMVCADGSPSSIATTRAVTSLPWVSDLVVHVVTVNDGRVDPNEAQATAFTMLEPTGAELVASRASGEPASRLIDYADAHKIDLIAMGTRGLSGLKRWAIGSTASAIAHTSEASVLVACDGATGAVDR